jgi:hypothetical protein
MRRPIYDLDKVKFSAGAPIFERACAIYESGGVRDFKSNVSGFSARVRGSGGNSYDAFVTARRFDEGNCSCYLGQKEILCKHMVAVALRALKRGNPLTDAEKQFVSQPVCSGVAGALADSELRAVKTAMTSALRLIKAYNGPSRIWFSYQASLSEGCNRLAQIVSELPVSKQTASLVVGLLLRLDQKLLQGGVDDSDGTVGDFMLAAAGVASEFVEVDPACTDAFRILVDIDTCFDWHERLVALASRKEN